MRGVLMQALLWPVVALAGARGTLFPWVPVFMACGIGGWFALADEPGRWLYLGAGAVVAGMALLWRFGPDWAQPFWVAGGCVAAGVLLAGLRTQLIAAPMLDFRYYGPVQGRVIEMDRSRTDALRLTLDRVVLADLPPGRTPAKVRLSVQGDTAQVPQPGQVVQVTAMLSPPEGPVEPGGFDFQRMAWFQQLGAVGYSRKPLVLWEEPGPWDQIVNRLRARLAGGVMAAIPGDAGAFAAGVMTGDRSGLSLQAVEDLRASSLAHLLAISGMNMAFLTGFVFALIRCGLALVPPLALRVNGKKVAALVSLPVAWFYLLLSGANVATERAFIMVAVMLVGVLLDRRALSLRTVALSAVVLLALRPESLLDAGFQMSFAATVALIAGFGALERSMLRGRLPKWVLPIFTLVLSSVLAGAATAPFGAAHFNRIADFGFVANLLTVPVMGAVVMPAGAVAALLAPLGLAALPLWIMGLGCRWILYIAHLVAGWEGAVTAVPAPGPLVLPLMAVGGIGLAVWRGWGRGVALLPMIAALVLWADEPRPVLLISPDGALVGMAGPGGRVLSVAAGAGFAAESWLQNDGDLVGQGAAATRVGFAGPGAARRFTFAGWRGLHLRGKTAAARAPAACREVDLLIVAAEVADLAGPCRLIDLGLLRRTGALALAPAEGALVLTPARRGNRYWQGRAVIRPGAQDLRLTRPPDGARRLACRDRC